VPDGTSADEDAGYLLSVVLNGEKGTSSLVVLDARSMTEVGRADCDLAVGFGFHGCHNPAGEKLANTY
jgi:torulene dioxygenase